MNCPYTIARPQPHENVILRLAQPVPHLCHVGEVDRPAGKDADHHPPDLLGAFQETASLDNGLPVGGGKAA